jgi:hypothetical protein
MTDTITFPLEIPIEDFKKQGYDDLEKYIPSIFELIERTFSRETDEKEAETYLAYLEHFYETMNKKDYKIIKNLRNPVNWETILNVYEDLGVLDNPFLENHRKKYINGQTQTNYMSQLFNMEIPSLRIPTNFELWKMVEKLQAEVEELKVRIANKDFLTERSATEKTTADVQ